MDGFGKVLKPCYTSLHVLSWGMMVSQDTQIQRCAHDFNDTEHNEEYLQEEGHIDGIL